MNRDEDALCFYRAASHDTGYLNHTSALSRHAPVMVKGTALVTFAQLATIRLGATHEPWQRTSISKVMKLHRGI